MVVRSMSRELQSFRERAHAAETRLQEIDSAADDSGPPHLRERLRALEQENASLRQRLEVATTRTRSVLDRVHFLRQQAEADPR